jgi:hypothetical protein
MTGALVNSVVGAEGAKIRSMASSLMEAHSGSPPQYYAAPGSGEWERVQSRILADPVVVHNCKAKSEDYERILTYMAEMIRLRGLSTRCDVWSTAGEHNLFERLKLAMKQAIRKCAQCNSRENWRLTESHS